jgi:hypothetical protein
MLLLKCQRQASTGVIPFSPAPFTFFTDVFASGDFAGGGGIDAQAFVAFAGQFAVTHLAHFGIAFAPGEQQNYRNRR